MKKYFLLILISFNFLTNAQISIGTLSPDAKFDIRASNPTTPSNNDGILIPRIDVFPATNPTISQHGMLVFLTTEIVGFPIGFYYWDNIHSLWKKVDAGNVDCWKTSGNTGTTNGTDFLGTLDEQAIDFRTNNTIHTRITQKGQIEVLNTGQSVFLGENAGKSDDLSMNQNVHIGFEAGFFNLQNQHNTSIGSGAFSHGNGDNNTANGYQSLFTNSQHNNNTATGFQSIYENKGIYNTAIGKQELYNAFGDYNTCVGYRGADYVKQLHDFSIYLGYIETLDLSSSYRINKIVIGNAVRDVSFISIYDDRLNIGNILFANNIQSPGSNSTNGNVGISVRDPQVKLAVNGAIKIGTTSNTKTGIIRWTGVDFEGYNGTKWLSLTKNNSVWNIIEDGSTENQIVTSSDGVAGDHFGFSVSISGNYAIIGAYGDEISGNNNQGSAYIFRRVTNTWIEEAKITASDGASSDFFGYSVALSGDYAIVGAYLDDASVSNQGSAYIFKRTGTNWNQEAKLIPNDWGLNDRFGYSVSISGDYAIIGTYLDDIAGNSNQGSAYVFKRSGTTWSQEAKIIASDGQTNDYFGNSVAIFGEYAIIGAYRSDVGGITDQGSAYIFKRNFSTWNQEAKIIASDGADSDSFAYSVAINDTYAIVGSPDDTIGSINNQGSSYVYKRTGSTWNEETKMIASDGRSRDNFGVSVSIDDTTAIIGAHNAKTNNHASQGIAYVFSKAATLWSKKIKLKATDGETDANFGNSVSIDGNYMIIGAPGAEKAYFFNK